MKAGSGLIIGSFPSPAESIESSAYPAAFLVIAKVVGFSVVTGVLGWNTWYLGIDHLASAPFSLALVLWSGGVVTLIWQVIEIAVLISRMLSISRKTAP